MAELLHSSWLKVQAAALVLYVLVTLPCLITKRQPWVPAGGFHLLLILALVAPFASLTQATFWSVLLASVLLWGILFWYESLLMDAYQRGNPGTIAYIVPIMAWGVSLPLAVALYVVIRFFLS